MTGVVDEVHRCKEVFRNDTLLGGDIAHGHDDIGRDEVTGAAVGAGIAGRTQPQIGIIETDITHAEIDAAHEVSNTVAAAGAGRAGPRAGSALETDVSFSFADLLYFGSERRIAVLLWPIIPVRETCCKGSIFVCFCTCHIGSLQIFHFDLTKRGFNDFGRTRNTQFGGDLFVQVGLRSFDVDAGSLQRESIFRRAGIDAGAAEDTQIVVDGDGGFDAVALHFDGRDRRRQIQSLARTYIDARRTAAGTLGSIDDEFAVEEFRDCNGFTRADLFTPGAGDTLGFVDRDLTRELDLGIDGPVDGYCIVRAGVDTDFAAVTEGFSPEDVACGSNFFSSERNTLLFNCRTKR